MRITNHNADAADCFQDVFMEVIGKRGVDKAGVDSAGVEPAGDRGDVVTRRVDDPVRDWAAYLSWLTTRRAIDCVRARRRRDSIYASSENDADQLPDAGHAVGALEFEELVQVVREELRVLPPPQSQAFWLVCVEQRSQEEVARQMRIRPGNVGVLVHRARKHLRNKLKHLSPDAASSLSREEL